VAREDADDDDEDDDEPIGGTGAVAQPRATGRRVDRR
jgi:hypothetical protein